MNFMGYSVVAMMGSLLLVSTAFAQSSSLPELPDRENTKSWTRFTSHTDKFDVLMPAAPTLKQETILIARQQLLLSYYGTRRGQSDYVVLTLDWPEWLTGMWPTCCCWICIVELQFIHSYF